MRPPGETDSVSVTTTTDRATSPVAPPADADIVVGDPQTVERVIQVLCKHFGYLRVEHKTLRSVVERLQDERRRGTAAISTDPPRWLVSTLVVRDESRMAEHPDVLTKQAAADKMLSRLTDTPLLNAPAALDILRVCLDLAAFLLEKNAAYGNSALDPIRAISKADPAEQIRVRMDDKLSRIMRGQAAGEDALKDFVGYWVLLEVLKGRADR